MVLPLPDYKETLNYADGSNQDIRETIQQNFPRAVEQTRDFAEKFKGANARETAYNIWKWVKTHCTYKKDEPEKQCVKLPTRFIQDQGYSDCKSFSLTTASLLANNGLPVKFRYSNYRGGIIPSHVYTVTQDESGKEIIVDAVWKFFDAEKTPTYKFDVPMNVYTLSGPENDVRPTSTFAHFIAKNDKNHNLQLERLKVSNPVRYAELISKLQARWVEWVKRKRLAKKLNHKLYSGSLSEMIEGIEEDYTELGWFGSKIFKAVGKGLKKVGGAAFKGIKKLGLAVPRRAFRTMVALNVKGLAKKLKRVNDKDAPALKKKWESLGGSYNSLKASIKAGYNRWAKGHKMQPMTGIYGCDVPLIRKEAIEMGLCGPEEPIGAFPVALVGAGATILAALMGLLKKHGEDPNAPEKDESTVEQIAHMATAAVDSYNNSNPGSGFSTDDPTDPRSAGQFDLQPGENDSPGINFSSASPILVLGLGVTAAFLVLGKGQKRR